MKKALITFVVFLLLIMCQTHVLLALNLDHVPNNSYGIHITDESDLENAASLVNSSGGQWGYVTIVIQENDLNREKWQRIFDKMRTLKLIPIVRIATSPKSGNWAIPHSEDAARWTDFLNSLNWVIENRYVILFNEPNQAKEWGGKINPSEYAIVVKSFSDSLKNASPHFFILPAGLDIASGNTKETIDAVDFWKKMYETDNNVFKYFDGWISHSYPNPGFRASVNKQGRLSIKGYEWELAQVEKYGVKKDLPIFITETGWIRENLYSKSGKYLGTNESLIADNYEKAFTSIWKDPKIQAVTPFILNYRQPPFDKFSWKKQNGDGFYLQYEKVKNITKTKGDPIQIQQSKFIEDSLPSSLIADSDYTLSISFENTGQSIWTKEDGFTLQASGDLINKEAVVDDLPVTKPGETAHIGLKIKTQSSFKPQSLNLALARNGKQFGEKVTREVRLIKPPSITIQAKLWPKKVFSAADFKLGIFENKELKLEIKDITIKNGFGVIGEVHNIIPEKKYTLTLSKPFYLAKSRVTILSKENTPLNFGYLFPLDFDGDSKLTTKDLNTILSKLTSPFTKN